MGLRSWSKQKIRNGVAHVGDGLSRRVSRGRGAFAGSVSGAQTLRGLRKSSKTYQNRSLLDEKLIQKALKEIHRTAAHLRHYDEKKIAHLQEKWHDQPEKLSKKIDHLVKQFMVDLQVFQSAYSEFILRVNDILVKEAQEMALENSSLLALIRQYEQKTAHDGVFVPEEVLHHAEKELRRLLNEKKVVEFKDYREAKREQITGKVRAGLFSPGATHVAHKLKKLLAKRRRKAERDFRTNLREIKRQLEQGVRQDFLSRFSTHVRNIELVDKMYRKIHHDALLMIMSVNKELDQAVSSIDVFLAMCRNEPAVKQSHIPAALESLNKKRSEMNQVLENDTFDCKVLYKQVNALDAQLKSVFSQLETVSKSVLHKVHENPQQFMKAAA